jgi:hypothetical protein
LLPVYQQAAATAWLANQEKQSTIEVLLTSEKR